MKMCIFVDDGFVLVEMKPWETYKADVSIDLKKHHAPTTFLDKMALWTVKTLRYPTDLFFQVFWISSHTVGTK